MTRVRFHALATDFSTVSTGDSTLATAMAR